MTTGAVSFQTSASTNQKQKSCYGKVEYWPEADEHEWLMGLGPKEETGQKSWRQHLQHGQKKCYQADLAWSFRLSLSAAGGEPMSGTLTKNTAPHSQ